LDPMKRKRGRERGRTRKGIRVRGQKKAKRNGGKKLVKKRRRRLKARIHETGKMESRVDTTEVDDKMRWENSGEVRLLRII